MTRYLFRLPILVLVLMNSGCRDGDADGWPCERLPYEEQVREVLLVPDVAWIGEFPATLEYYGGVEAVLTQTYSLEQRRVYVQRPFWMMAHEMTVGEYRALMGTVPPTSGCEGDLCPVDYVTFANALGVANARSRAEGLQECYDLSGCEDQVESSEWGDCPQVSTFDWDCTGWRLPTNVEWEFATRAGVPEQFFCGASSGRDAGWPCPFAYGWFDRYRRVDTYPLPYPGAVVIPTVPVGLHCPNQWGLYDTYGNVQEYVWEWVENTRVEYDFLPQEGDPDRIDTRDGVLLARGGFGPSPVYATGSSSLDVISPGFELMGFAEAYPQGVRLVRTATDEDLANHRAANE